MLSWSHPSLALGKLALTLTGHCSKIAAPQLGRDDPIPHHGQERTDPEDLGYGSWLCPLPEASGLSGPC